MVYDRHGKIQTNNLFDSQYLVRALHILFENYHTSCAVVLERQGAGFIPHLAWLSLPFLSIHAWTASWDTGSSKARPLSDKSRFPRVVNENQDARKGETYEGDDFPGNRVSSRSPEQEVQEEASDQLLTSRRSGVST